MDLISLREAGRDQHGARSWIPILHQSRARFGVPTNLLRHIPGNRGNAINDKTVGRCERQLRSWLGGECTKRMEKQGDEAKHSVHKRRECFHIQPLVRSKKCYKIGAWRTMSPSVSRCGQN